MLFAESDLLPISALQHLLYCDRQCALIHIERLWVENRFTAEGALLHRKAHSGRSETRSGSRTTRALPVRSFTLGLFGMTDVVELDLEADAAAVPVEYKRGRPKRGDCDRVQLCAQALCLEEMMGRPVEYGEIFYGRTRRRSRVDFTSDLRQTTADAAVRLHDLIRSGQTPRAEPGRKCDRCSLREVCLPRLGPQATSARRHFDRTLDALLRDREKP